MVELSLLSNFHQNNFFLKDNNIKTLYILIGTGSPILPVVMITMLNNIK